MKLKVKVKDFDGKEKVLEKEGRNLDHLKAQQTYKHIVFRNKKKYNRKRKHRNKEEQ